MLKPITFYDINSNLPSKPWSPNTWKTRFSLNYKGLPYQTEWIEYPDIEPLAKKIGIHQAGQLFGARFFSLPAIHDPNTNTTLNDSALIAEYLDKTYPDTPKLLQPGTHAMQHAFAEAFLAKIEPILSFTIPEVPKLLYPRSLEYFERTREEWSGKKLKDWIPTGKAREEEWAKVKVGFDAIDKWYQSGEKEGPFILGKEPGFADFIIASFIVWFRIIWGADNALWKDFLSWNEGRWAARLQLYEKYTQVL